MAWIECVPNVSEGRRPEVVAACAAALRTAGLVVLDVTRDADHNRSVYTLAGTRDTLPAGIRALFAAALPAIDMRAHAGEHPCIGAVDVVPFVPLAGTTMAECVTLAHAIGDMVASTFDVPVFFYEEAALSRDRRNLSEIRRGRFAGLADRLHDPAWAPDRGPHHPHVTAGATVIGARGFLIAYNVNLATDRIAVARAIARTIRGSHGGLPTVKAMGVALADRGIVQVSMNLTDFRTTPIVEAFDAVARAARVHGVEIVESELVGLAPAAALSRSIAEHVRLRDFREDRILEHALEAHGVRIG